MRSLAFLAGLLCGALLSESLRKRNPSRVRIIEHDPYRKPVGMPTFDIWDHPEYWA